MLVGKQRVKDVYQVAVPNDSEMDRWAQETIEKLAARSGASKRVRILAARIERDTGYKRIQSTWHNRLIKFATGLLVAWCFGGVFVAVFLADFVSTTFGLGFGMDTYAFAAIGLPLALLVIAYVITGLVAAADRGFEAFLFRKSVMWIEKPEEAMALLDQELEGNVSRRALRIPWVWRFW